MYEPTPNRRQPVFNAPSIVLWLVGVTFGMHLFLYFGPGNWVRQVELYLTFNPAHVQFFDEYPVEIATRWVGHALVHFGWLHLFVNCAFLLAFGTPIARQVPAYSFILLYALGAVGGAAFSLFSLGGEDVYLVGASGAVSALAGALSRMVFLRRGAEVIPFPFSDRRSGTIFVLSFFVVNLLFFVMPGPGGVSVSGESHIGGFLAGFILSIILPWHRRRDETREGE